jgi:lipopolysaccharide transport system permease protein
VSPEGSPEHALSGSTGERERLRVARARRTPSLTIEPPGRWQALDLGEIWHYRELVYFLTWRELRVRYKQTFFGGSWAVLQPFLTMVVFTVVFSRLIKVPSQGIPYPAFSYAALLPWTFFATAMARGGNSLVQDPNLLSKVYFPRLALPMASVSALLVDFGIAFVILIGMLVFYGIVPGAEVLTLPLFLALAYFTALAVAVWLSAINVKYRDITYVVPLLSQFWLFLTPVAYPITLIPDEWRVVYGLNPMVGVVEGFRWALFGTESAGAATLLVSAAVVLVVCVSGLFYFRRTEREFADVV